MSPRVSRTLLTIDPILLTPRGDPFDDPAWLFEPKYDGYRGLLYVTRKGCHFRSKRGNILKRFEELCLSMAPTSQPLERPAIPGRFIPSVRGSRALAGTRSGRRYRQALAQGSGVEGHGGSPPAQVEVFRTTAQSPAPASVSLPGPGPGGRQ